MAQIGYRKDYRSFTQKLANDFPYEDIFKCVSNVRKVYLWQLFFRPKSLKFLKFSLCFSVSHTALKNTFKRAETIIHNVEFCQG